METAIRETAAPWYLRQAEFDDVQIVLCDNRLDTCTVPFIELTEPTGVWRVGWSAALHRIQECWNCGYTHVWHASDPAPHGRAYDGDSLEEAEAAYAELERKLLAGELR